MRLQDVLNRISSDSIKAVQTAYVWERFSTPWPEALLHPDELFEAANRLSVWSRRLLGYWILTVGPLPIQEEKLLNRSVPDAGLAAAEMKAAVQELCACGILYAVRKSWGERLLFMPADCYIAWRQTLDEDDEWAELTRSSSGEKLDTAPGATFTRRLLRAYATLERLGLTLTGKGLFPKKTVDNVTRLLDMPVSNIMARLRPVHENVYPVPFAMALDIALKLGLIQFEDGRYNWSVSALDDWLGGDERIREAEMAQLVTMMYGFHSPQEAFFTSGLLKLEPRCQFTTNAGMGLDPFHIEWMRFLDGCGWAQYEADADGGCTFRWLIDPIADRRDALESAHGEAVIVLPDGELIVPPYAGLAVRWKLERIAQWVRDDVVSIYRITAESAASAAERGMQADEQLMLLQEAAGGIPLPDELVHAIRHWSASACRTSVEDVVLLRCEAKEIADAISERTELKELLVERLGDRTFIVRAEKTAKLRKELERAGWPPLMNEADRSRSAASHKAEASASGKRRNGTQQPLTNGLHSFIYNEHAVERYELLAPTLAPGSSDGAIEQWFPSDWPTAWTGPMRSYHHSTRKLMIESALEWGAPIQLVTGGQSVELLPERLESGSEPWLVSGYIRKDSRIEHVRLSPDMWEEMRIVIPRMAPNESGS
ncbi:helicase-associated domain-containing protein [Paenibacillus kobensis]|uniref:helicase-associated domain-containing protein n=1 Tax=Paenibacillus kobensis TaxID=59841 RepID=UPI000FD8001F|nr:helicase-associated domain-containing protein [Paenibacillus kobensis]